VNVLIYLIWFAYEEVDINVAVNNKMTEEPIGDGFLDDVLFQ